jgi:hypothetical protein
MVLPFFFPATLILGLQGPESGEEPSKGGILRLIQVPFTSGTNSFERQPQSPWDFSPSGIVLQTSPWHSLMVLLLSTMRASYEKS